ncbi:MAG TPA: murein biosynthesis integral membrane protein MurJ [Vicinamibacterales bacterium]|nr:murein biosynthesis integral membrane protein MurJ [Vicinamibacterales bacterium]
MSRAVFVAAGILISRISGFIRARVFAHYFGLSDSADAFNAAFRIPNFLQNLFGEGALSASFIPVYAALVSRGRRIEADRVAGAIFSLVAAVISVLVLAGVLATPLMIALIAPGFTGAKRELAVTLTRILFPGTGMLVLSAWCLGILNSHHRFTLSYAAPLMMNAAMIAAMALFGSGRDLSTLAVYLAWGAVLGSVLQFAVQLPVVLAVAPDLRFGLDLASEHVRTIARNFVPAFVSRGVVQLSAYIDSLLASLLPTGAVTGLMNASLLYTLPVSLFGVSVAASELPAMSGDASLEGAGAEAVRVRLDAGLRRIAFFVVPSSVAFIALGDVVAGAVLQTGRFTRSETEYVWAILAGSAIGLVASTLGRLYSSTFYALRDTRTPLRFAIVRVTLTTALGYLCAIPLPHLLGLPARWGAAGLTASAGLAGWVEMLLLRNALRRRIGSTGMPAAYVASLWGAAIAGGAVGWLVKWRVPPLHPVLHGAAVLVPYGLTYFAVALVLRVPEAAATIRRVVRR